MDDALRRLERETRERPADLSLGRAYAEALRRAGERQRCFVELSRLSRFGDLQARHEVTRWIPWPGTRGRGDTCYRDCEPLGATGLEYEVGALPSTSEGWSFLTVSDERAILASQPPINTQEPMQLLQIDLRGGSLAAGWAAPIHGSQVVPYGDDLVVLDRRRLATYSGAHGHEIERRPLPVGEDPHGFVLVADLAVATSIGGDHRAGYHYRHAAHPIVGGDAAVWEIVGQSHLHKPVRGCLQANHRRTADGRILSPSDLSAWREADTEQVFELRDPGTGQVMVSVSTRSGEWNELLAWDDDALVLSDSRSPRELRARLDSPPVPLTSSHLGDGVPRPVLAAEQLVQTAFVQEHPFFLLQALDRRTGTPLWAIPSGMSMTQPGLESGLAAAGQTLYVVNGRLGELELRGHDLRTGATTLELRLPYGVGPDDPAGLLGGGTASHMGRGLLGPRLVQLAPIEGGLLLLVASTSGPKLIRVR